MKMYITLMTAYGVSAGINYKFGGTVANTIDAHRMIQHYQEENGPEVADKLVSSLYKSYFEDEKHPSSKETLLKAAMDAGLDEKAVEAFIEDENEGLLDVKMLIREQAADGVDSVPNIVIEGKRRDLSIVGAKDIEEYVKALEQIIKESN
jgi:predicted DsbA family dithiol-disulfide isomerase